MMLVTLVARHSPRLVLTVLSLGLERHDWGRAPSFEFFPPFIDLKYLLDPFAC